MHRSPHKQTPTKCNSGWPPCRTITEKLDALEKKHGRNSVPNPSVGYQSLPFYERWTVWYIKGSSAALLSLKCCRYRMSWGQHVSRRSESFVSEASDRRLFSDIEAGALRTTVPTQRRYIQSGGWKDGDKTKSVGTERCGLRAASS